MPSKQNKAVSDQVRALIEGCGMSRYQLAKLTGIDQSALSRFMSGERGLSMEALDAIGDALEFKVTSCIHRRR